ncbi:carbonic anhydrase [Bdellovibrio sp. HCB337]|uniref:carbonic anhydrase n=1 Tax=Bdellovibrio sp. HCB337 TaxID=3394358 RepID=UPI0039A64C90
MRILYATLVGLSLTACASKQPAKTETAQKSPAPVAAAPAPTPPPEVAEFNKIAAKEAEAMKLTLKPAAAKADSHQHAAPAAAHSKRGSVPSEKALGWLKNGNTRFVKHSLRNDGDRAKDRTRLSEGQKPHSIVLSCSDSRVPPEVVFDQKLGEIFVVRTAGQALDFGAIASIEYAIEHLGSNLILVMGHESCGAVKAALATLNGSDAGSPWLNGLVHDLQPHLKSFAGKPVSEHAAVEGWANTEGVAKDLVSRSQIVRDAVNTGEVKIQTALYHLGTGKVEFR